jgi:Holliday junction resolvase RusA-like endonuclease
MYIFTVPGTPIGKPRMTRRDKWKRRPNVQRYRAWADSVRLVVVRSGFTAAALGFPHNHAIGVAWLAVFSRPKRGAQDQPNHTVKPDRDNIDKALLDSLFEHDQVVSCGLMRKIYDDGRGPRLVFAVWDIEAEGVFPDDDPGRLLYLLASAG